MARLINRYEQSIDDKGRLVLPAAHRDRYAGGCVLASRDDHIAIYEPAAWDEFVLQLVAKRSAGELSRSNFNLITSSAADPKPDSAGRVLIPSWMREEVGLGREVVVAGAHEYLAIHPAGYFTAVSPEVKRAAFAKIDELGL